MNTKKLFYSVISVIMFISGAAMMFYFLWENGYIDMPKSAAPSEEYADFTYPSLPADIKPTEQTTKPSEETEETGTEPAETEYQSPIDFVQLKKANADVIGWIHMTNPDISQPLVMHKKNDSYYLSHGPDGKYNKKGSFYIERSYNNADLEDPVTIIYGHRKSDGSMFGTLQKTMEKIDLANNPQYVVIYLPNSTKTYHIIATIRHDSSHVLVYNNFNKKADYDKFFNMVYSSKGTGVQLVAGEKPEFGDKVLILSTCFKTDRNKRFLVIAKELT